MKSNAKNSALFLTPAELASRWQVTTMTLRRWRKSGRIKTVHLGRGIRFAIADIEQLELEAKS
jgi:excisionase family DNA binding protein